MAKFQKITHLVQNLTPVTTNRKTDEFGLGRDWGKTGWTPREPYSPLHLGVDYSASPSKRVIAPCDGIGYGMKVPFVPRSVGEMVMFIPTEGGAPRRDIAFYFLHVKSIGSKWRGFRKGDVVSIIDPGHRPAHLHLELAMTESAFITLSGDGLITGAPIDVPCVAMRRAEEEGLPGDEVLERVNDIMKRWKIESVSGSWLKKSSYPGYKLSRYSSLRGKGEIFIVDPETFVKGGKTYKVMSIKKKSLSDEVVIDGETFLVDLKTHNEKMGPYMITELEAGAIGKEVESGRKRYIIQDKVLRDKYAISYLKEINW